MSVSEPEKRCLRCGGPVVRRPRVNDRLWALQLYCGPTCQHRASNDRSRAKQGKAPSRV